jgi:hypothetical protein
MNDKKIGVGAVGSIGLVGHSIFVIRGVKSFAPNSASPRQRQAACYPVSLLRFVHLYL